MSTPIDCFEFMQRSLNNYHKHKRVPFQTVYRPSLHDLIEQDSR